MYQPFNGYYNGFNGVGSINIPPQQQMGVQSVLTPSMTITRVNGENGARALQMQPNSSVLLLDETAPIVWLAQTDGAGYKTVTPYKIEPYQPKTIEEANSNCNFTNDIEKLNERITKLEERINGKSYSSNDERNKSSGK